MLCTNWKLHVFSYSEIMSTDVKTIDIFDSGQHKNDLT